MKKISRLLFLIIIGHMLSSCEMVEIMRENEALLFGELSGSSCMVELSDTDGFQIDDELFSSNVVPSFSFTRLRDKSCMDDPLSEYPLITGKAYDILCSMSGIDVYLVRQNEFCRIEKGEIESKQSYLQLYYLGRTVLSDKFESHLILATSRFHDDNFYIKRLFLINTDKDRFIKSYSGVNSLTHLAGGEDSFSTTELIWSRPGFWKIIRAKKLINDYHQRRENNRIVYGFDARGSLNAWITNPGRRRIAKESSVKGVLWYWQLGKFVPRQRVDDKPIMSPESEALIASFKFPMDKDGSVTPGVVLVSYRIDTTGNTFNHEIVKGLSTAYDSSALKAAKQICYSSPARAKGEKVPSNGHWYFFHQMDMQTYRKTDIKYIEFWLDD